MRGRLLFFEFRALDNALTHTLGAGLDTYTNEAGGNDEDVSGKPLLVLHFDEASSNLALFCWMYYHLRLRVIGMRDIFHREGNDVLLALKSSGLWYVILITTVVFNLPCGPWDGAGWWHKLIESARDFVELCPDGSRLFDELYAGLCKDEGSTPYGGTADRLERLRHLGDNVGFQKKGPRVALRRWFSWIQSVLFHDAVWHSRAIAILSMGIASGVYKAAWDSPLWSDGVVDRARPATGDGPQDDEEEQKEEAKGAVEEAKKVASKDPPADTEPADGQVKHSGHDVAGLRRKCRNTLYVAAVVLMMPGLQNLVRLICET